jgi:hypothetical protein
LSGYVRICLKGAYSLKEIKIILRFDQNKKELYDTTELYQEVNKRLTSKQIATSVTQCDAAWRPLWNGNVFHIEMPFLVKNDINSNMLTIENIKSELKDLFDKKDLYSNFRIIEEI